MPDNSSRFSGFFIRTVATLIDAALLAVITIPIGIILYGWDYLDPEKTGFVAGPADFVLSWIFPAVAVIWFWVKWQATPGKMAFSIRIVDAATGSAPSLTQYIVRYVGYYVALLPLGIGLFWIIFDPKKQGWHDKMARTVVVKNSETSQPST